MARSTQPEIAETFAENTGIPPMYCTGLASVLVEDGNIHFALYQDQISGDGSREKVIVLRVIMPEQAWIIARDLTESKIAEVGHLVPRVTHRGPPVSFS